MVHHNLTELGIIYQKEATYSKVASYLFHFLIHTGTKQTKYIGVFVHKSVVETELERCVVSCVLMQIRAQIAVI